VIKLRTPAAVCELLVVALTIDVENTYLAELDQIYNVQCTEAMSEQETHINHDEAHI
jgi:hypothetical protein